MTGNNITYRDKCYRCGKEEVFKIPVAGFIEWRRGSDVHDAFPDIPEDVKDFLALGVHPECLDIPAVKRSGK